MKDQVLKKILMKLMNQINSIKLKYSIRICEKEREKANNLLRHSFNKIVKSLIHQ